MASPFIGEIEIFGFTFAPKGWAVCAGQTMSIAQNQALFSLLGITFGGNGTTTFNLPDLRGRLPMGQGTGNGLTPRTVGDSAGAETWSLVSSNIPPHRHSLMVATKNNIATNADTPSANVVLATTTGKNEQGQTITVNIYATDANPSQALDPTAISQTGGQPHDNRMPYLALNFCIALNGIYPSRS
jgi:microcystin-dependent protein